jgi:hypothetical protein
MRGWQLSAQESRGGTREQPTGSASDQRMRSERNVTKRPRIVGDTGSAMRGRFCRAAIAGDAHPEQYALVVDDDVTVRYRSAVFDSARWAAF